MNNSGQLNQSTLNLAPELFANEHYSMLCWWRDGLLHRVELGPGKTKKSSGDCINRYSRIIHAALERHVRGKNPDWDNLPLDWAVITSAFQRSVLKTLMDQIGHGHTTSYKELARMAGFPGAARAVGQAVGSNPWPLIVPCHRVLTSSGMLGGFSSGIEMKKMLLFLEGWPGDKDAPLYQA